MAKPIVYRVEDIPEHTSRDDLKHLFTQTCQPQIKVASLSKAADWNEQNRIYTATCSFTPRTALEKPEFLDAQLSMDSDFYGFTPLYTPDGLIDADIIALTGLAGHAYGSWAISAEKMWLRDFLPRDLPRCRMLTYGYDSRLGANESRGILFDHSTNFIVKLQDMRYQNQCLDRPIVFIGHSLGCLIMKEALINFHSFLDKKKDQKLPPVICLVCIGAPHRGLEVAALQSLVKGRPSEELVRELKKHSPTLTRQNADFKNLYGEFHILTIFEMKDTSSVRQAEDGSWDKDGPLVTMVEKDSAILYWEKEQTIGVNQDHRQIARIDRGQSGCYNQIRGFIKKSLENSKKPKVILSVGQGVIRSSTDPHDQIKLIDDFFLAVRNGGSRKIRASLDRGMSVNCHKGDRHTALHIATEWATADIVQLLLANGAKIDIRNADGWTPFHFASRFNSATTLALLLKEGAKLSDLTWEDKCTSLHLAARYNKSTDVVETLIAAGAEIDAREINDWTPLHLAVRYGNRPEVIRLLVREGAAVNTSTDESYTALHLAAGHSETTILELLLDAGADLKARDSDGWTPLHWAVRFGRDLNVNELLRRAADYRAKSSAGTMPANVGFVDTVPELTKDLIIATIRTRGGS